MGVVLRRHAEPVCEALGLEVDGGAWERLEQLGTLWLQYGRGINLSGAKGTADLAEHVVEGLAAVECAKRASGTGAWLDVGSGAGFPGLVVAALGWEVTLVEPRQKRAAFLRLALASIGGTGEVRRARWDDGTWQEIAPGGVEGLDGRLFGVASARAVWGPDRWWAIGRGLVGPGGVVIVHGEGSEREGAGGGHEVWSMEAGRWRVRGVRVASQEG